MPSSLQADGDLSGERMDSLLAFIAAAPWRFAKTMPETPHEYTVRGQTDDRAFVAFVRAIRELGYKARWGRYNHTYLNIGGWKYWTMGAPVNKTIIINRAALPDA